MHIALLLFLDRLGRQGSTESFCNFNKLSYIWIVFSYFLEKNKYTIRVSVHCIGSGLKSWLIEKWENCNFFYSDFFVWFLYYLEYMTLMPPRKSCSAGVKNEIPSRKQSSRSPENHDDLKTNKLRSTIPLMDLLPPSLTSLSWSSKL